MIFLKHFSSFINLLLTIDPLILLWININFQNWNKHVIMSEANDPVNVWILHFIQDDIRSFHFDFVKIYPQQKRWFY